VTLKPRRQRRCTLVAGGLGTPATFQVRHQPPATASRRSRSRSRSSVLTNTGPRIAFDRQPSTIPAERQLHPSRSPRPTAEADPVSLRGHPSAARSGVLSLKRQPAHDPDALQTSPAASNIQVTASDGALLRSFHGRSTVTVPPSQALHPAAFGYGGAGRKRRSSAATGSWWVTVSTESTTQWSQVGSPPRPWAKLMTGDFNGDGPASTVVGLNKDGSWWVGLSTGSGFCHEPMVTMGPPPRRGMRSTPATSTATTRPTSSASNNDGGLVGRPLDRRLLLDEPGGRSGVPGRELET